MKSTSDDIHYRVMFFYLLAVFACGIWFNNCASKWISDAWLALIGK